MASNKGSKGGKGDAAKSAANEPEASTLAPAEIAEDGAILLEDWAPLGRCLDVRLGRAAWPTHAASLFRDEQVPHLAHDSGALSRRHAAVLLAWCEARAAEDALPERIVLVEAGIGTGLHLCYLLRHFAAASEERGVDWAERLQVWVTDVSAELLDKARSRSLFPERFDVRYALLDVVRPERVLPIDADGQLGEAEALPPIHAFFANYVLDLMPMDLFRRAASGTDDAPRWQAALVRTWLREPGALSRHTDLDVDGIRGLVAQGGPGAWAALAPIWSLLQLELRTFPLQDDDHPDLALLETVADAIEAELGVEHEALADGTVVLHSGGALTVVQRIGAALAETGFAIFRDVALVTAAEAAVPRGLTHYGPTTAVGVSFYELDRALAGGALRFCGPAHDGPRAQASRMLLRREDSAVEQAFAAALDGEALAAVEARVAGAREEADPNAAIEAYRAALAEEPDNWVLLLEAGKVALERGRNARLAALLAREGLRINAVTAADLWRLLGDALWALGDRASAYAAYRAALEIRPADPHAHYGAAFVDGERGRFESAMRHIGEALAGDHDGNLRADVLRLLDACLRGQTAAVAAERERLAGRAGR